MHAALGLNRPVLLVQAFWLKICIKPVHALTSASLPSVISAVFCSDYSLRSVQGVRQESEKQWEAVSILTVKQNIIGWGAYCRLQVPARSAPVTERSSWHADSSLLAVSSFCREKALVPLFVRSLILSRDPHTHILM